MINWIMHRRGLIIVTDMIFRVERKERARLKNVKFHGRGADVKGVSVISFCWHLQTILFSYINWNY